MDHGRDLIGWAASVILVASLSRQTYRQWRAGTSRGVSKWLYLGSLVSSALFAVYSFLLGNWVFLVTNSLLVVDNVLGLAILYHHRKREGDPGRRTGDEAAPAPAAFAADA